MRALLVLLLALPARAEPPERPSCETLLAAARPDGEAGAAWDECSMGREGGGLGTALLSGPAVTQPPAVSESLREGGLRVAAFSDPFERSRSAGSLLDGAGVPAGPGGYGPGAVPYTSLGSPRRSDLGLTVPPAQRVESAFSAFDAGALRPAFDAATQAALPGPPSTFWVLPRPVVDVTWLEGRMDLTTPQGPLLPVRRLASPSGGDSAPMIGAGAYGSIASVHNAKDVAGAMASMRFKAAVTQAFTSALGMTALRGITVETQPGNLAQRQDHRTTARVDFGAGALTGFVETGYEALHGTKDGKSIRESGVPVRGGLTVNY